MKHTILALVLLIACGSPNKAVQYADAMRAAAGPTAHLSCTAWGSATDDSGASYDVALCHAPGVVLRCTASAAVVPKCEVLASRSSATPTPPGTSDIQRTPDQPTAVPPHPVPPIPERPVVTPTK